jgi:phosphoribosyl 1,2-cyclic phosphodiesterase
MSGVFEGDGGRSLQPGGIIGYPLERLYEEVAYLAYHFHWPRDTILSMEHGERLRWVGEVASINRRLNEPVEEGQR